MSTPGPDDDEEMPGNEWWVDGKVVIISGDFILILEIPC